MRAYQHQKRDILATNLHKVSGFDVLCERPRNRISRLVLVLIGVQCGNMCLLNAIFSGMVDWNRCLNETSFHICMGEYNDERTTLEKDGRLTRDETECR